MSLKIVIIGSFLIFFTFLMVFWINSVPIQSSKKITSFDDCLKAGYPIQESKPRKCSVPGGNTYIEVEKVPVEPSFSPEDTTEPLTSDQPVLGISNSSPSATTASDSKQSLPANGGKICTNKCGDTICQLVVCQGGGCPCAENESTCPQDCQ
jgi:hypothetical protein